MPQWIAEIMAVVVFGVGVVQVAVREVLQPMEPVAHSVPAHLDQDILIQLQILNMDEVEAVKAVKAEREFTLSDGQRLLRKCDVDGVCDTPSVKANGPT